MPDKSLNITLNKVSLDWYAEDEDAFDIGIKHALEFDYAYTLPPHMEGVTHNDVNFTAAYRDSLLDLRLLSQIKKNGALHEAVADYLDNRREEIEQAEKDAWIESQSERYGGG